MPPVNDVFSDIQGHWAHDSIIAMANKNIVNGDGSGKFNPDSNVTRAEIVTMAVRMLNLKTDSTPSAFEDVSPDSWYALYVSAALEAGIISPDKIFRPNDFVTREEMSKILVMVAEKYLGTNHAVPGDYTVEFTDGEKIADWALPFVASANYHGYVNGMSDGSFAPGSNATRAQIATVLNRIVSK